jgi:hypothetical protein
MNNNNNNNKVNVSPVVIKTRYINLILDSHHSKCVNNELPLLTCEQRIQIFNELTPYVIMLMKDKVYC